MGRIGAFQHGKPRKIDEKDKKILKILFENAREPITSIAKQVKLSHDAVRYRIKKLKEDRIIYKYEAILNPHLLGFNIVSAIFVSLKNYTEEDKKKFIQFLVALQETDSIDETSGDYDMEIDIMAKDPEDFGRICDLIREKFGHIIKDWKSHIYLKEYKFQSTATNF